MMEFLEFLFHPLPFLASSIAWGGISVMDKTKQNNMSNQYKLRGSNGLYFVNGKGFAAKAADASILLDASISCLAEAGFTGTKEAAVTSYAVCYIRKDDKVVNGVLVQVKPDASKNQLVPSKRRFATEDEAWQHGTNARLRKANRGDKPGTAGHKGFFVIETNDPVNAVVNWKSGLTNPIKA